MATDIQTFAQIQTVDQFNDSAEIANYGANYNIILTVFPIAAHVSALRVPNPDVPIYIFFNPYFGFGDRFYIPPGNTSDRDQAILDYGMVKTDDSIMPYAFDADTPLMDVTNSDWQDHASAQILKYTLASGADGAFIDTIPEDIPLVIVVPELPKNYVEATWIAESISFLDHVLAEMGSIPTLTNTGTRAVSDALPIPNATIRSRNIAGETIEAFGVEDPIDESTTNLEWYINQTILNDLASISTNQIVLIEVTATSDSEDMRLYALCGYLLKSNSNTYFYFTTVTDHSTNTIWRSEWDTKIGAPSSSSVQHASGIHYREFENGLTMVNATSGELSMDISGIHSEWRHWNGRDALTTITLPAHSGKLLLKGSEPKTSWR